MVKDGLRGGSVGLRWRPQLSSAGSMCKCSLGEHAGVLAGDQRADVCTHRFLSV